MTKLRKLNVIKQAYYYYKICLSPSYDDINKSKFEIAPAKLVFLSYYIIIFRIHSVSSPRFSKLLNFINSLRTLLTSDGCVLEKLLSNINIYFGNRFTYWKAFPENILVWLKFPWMLMRKIFLFRQFFSSFDWF